LGDLTKVSNFSRFVVQQLFYSQIYPQILWISSKP